MRVRVSVGFKTRVRVRVRFKVRVRVSPRKPTEARPRSRMCKVLAAAARICPSSHTCLGVGVGL